jgi:hypothetical protein
VPDEGDVADGGGVIHLHKGYPPAPRRSSEATRDVGAAS